MTNARARVNGEAGGRQFTYNAHSLCLRVLELMSARHGRTHPAVRLCFFFYFSTETSDAEISPSQAPSPSDFSSLRGLMAEAAEAPLCDVPMLHTGELVASDAAATAHRAPSLELCSRSVWIVGLAAKVTAEDDQISGFASLWLACSWVRGGQPERGASTDFLMQVLLESPICSYFPHVF